MKTAALLLLAFALPAFAEEADKAASPAQPAASESKAEITVPGAKGDAAAKAKLRADAAIARCVIKPVMTDEEINVCVRAYRQGR